MKSTLKKAWNWLKSNALAVAASVGAVALSLLFWSRRSREVGNLREAVQLEKAKVQVASLNAQKDVLKARAEDTEELEALVEKRIKDIQKTIVERQSEVDGMSDEQVADEFERLYSGNR